MQGEGADEELRAPRTKEGDVRRREVSERLANWLERWMPLENRVKGHLPLFQRPDARIPSKRWAAKPLRNVWTDAAASIGLGKVELYEGTTHSTLTALANAGERREVLAAIAGHKRLESTERYVTLATSTLSRAIRARDRLI